MRRVARRPELEHGQTRDLRLDHAALNLVEGNGAAGLRIRSGMIEIKQGRYFAAFWFVASPGVDWLAALWRDSGRPWQIVHRFRYDSDPPRSSEDERVWTECAPPPKHTEEQIMVTLDNLAERLRTAQRGSRAEKLVLQTDDAEKVLRALAREPFVRFRGDDLLG